MNLEKKLIAFALFSCTFMGAVEITIVTTAIPSIVRDLNGFNLSSYLFSIYLLTSAVATTIFGKLSDLYGRKKLLQISIVIFILGSLLCGLSNSMPLLIISRGVQGLGSGAINTLTMATIGDIFGVEDRARIQGYNSTVWSIGGLIAPILGGIILIRLSWHWVFFINVPIGILSMILIHRSYKATETKSDDKLDLKGLFTLTLIIICLIQAMSALEKHSIFSPNVGGLAVLAIIFTYVFTRIEKNVEYPVIPYKLFSKEILVVMIISFLNSTILIAMDVYNPSFLQNVQDYPPIVSTVPIVPMSVFWVVSSFILSRYIHKFSTKAILIVSLSILAIGCCGLVLLTPKSSPLFMGIYSAIIGLGFGGSFNMLLFIVQETVSKDDIGMASGSIMFVRTLGQTLGVSAFGFILNSSIVKYFSKTNIDIDPANILSNTAIDKTEIIKSLFAGYNNVYWGCLIVGIVCVIFALLLPSNKILKNYNN